MMSVKTRKTISVIFSVLLLMYVGYQLFFKDKKNIMTEEATFGRLTDTIQATAFVIRDETIIRNDYTGVLNYAHSDGSKISKGGAIADIYAAEKDATAQGQLERLSKEIETLKKLSNPGHTHVTNTESINEQIYVSIHTLRENLRKNDFSAISNTRDLFQIGINRKNIVTEIEFAEDYSKRIQNLEEQKANLEKETGEKISQIFAPKSGYFISKTDGFENAVRISDIENLTAANIEELIEKEAVPSEEVVGKICPEFNWYLACVINKNDAIKLEDITDVELEIPFATAEKIPVEIVTKNEDRESGNVAVVFKTNYMNGELSKIRNETIQINVKTYTGVLVNEKRSVVFEDIEREEENEEGEIETVVHKQVRGVYIKNGSNIEFVQIFSDKTMNGYAICKTELSEEEKTRLYTDRTISMYDEVVVDGVNLYDGKLII
jgi:hypothetical protein